MCRRIYFFPPVGGGVHGKAAGIAHVTMTEVGVIIAVYHLFTEIFLRAGEMITGIICGEDIGGNINEYPIKTFNAIGTVGKETGIGKGKTHGECRDCLPDASKEIRGLSSLSTAMVIIIRGIDHRKDIKKDMIDDKAA
jgi:hypothetical protein